MIRDEYLKYKIMLSEKQKEQLNKVPVKKLLEYIDKGVAVYPDDFGYVDEEKKNQVERELSTRPDPREVLEWKSIESLLPGNSEALRIKLKAYISNWGSKRPSGNHVDEAKHKISEIDAFRAGEKVRKEQEEWDNVDLFDKSLLMAYLRKYPDTVHMAEIDDAVWSLALSSISKIRDINEYLSHFPNGRHVSDARRALNEYAAWNEVKTSKSLSRVFDYINDNEDSPFINDAKILLTELKEQEMSEMKAKGSKYPPEPLLSFLDKGVFSREELIANEVLTNETLDILIHLGEIVAGLPDIDDAIARCTRECAEDCTDVFLFGIPATGKSCILMGLIGCPDIDIDSVSAGGPYAQAMQEYLDAGFCIGQTPADFVATLRASIPNGKQTHYVNLVEMAGEDFAFKLAQNPDSTKISFADMGAGVPELLRNNNRKAFFLIVDPTTRVVTFKRQIKYIDAEGVERTSTTMSNVNQLNTLKRMVDLFRKEENADIMKKVDSIHVIVTKADTCGNDLERDDKAYALITQNYQKIILPLVEVCDKYGINVATDGFPKMYTFSLGEFCVGGIYQYDPTDAVKLVDVIRRNVYGEKKPSFLDKVRAIVNKPII